MIEKPIPENNLNLNFDPYKTNFEDIKESQNEWKKIIINKNGQNSSIIIKKYEDNLSEDKNNKKIISTNLNFNIPESCSLSQRELLLNTNNNYNKSSNGRFKDFHTGNTLNTFESLVGKFFKFCNFQKFF